MKPEARVMSSVANSSPTRPQFQLGYAKIHHVDLQQAVERILELAQGDACSYVVTPNSDHIVQLEDDRLLRVVYQDASLVVADGMPIVWASQILGPRLPGRVTGADLLPNVCAAAAKEGLSIFLLGAPEGIAEVAANNLKFRYPSLKVVGCYSPPFGFENDTKECQRIVDLINQGRPEIVFVALGAPKQEYWMHRYRGELDAKVLLGVGAAVEFAAGALPRAPLWMQKSGLEWSYRLMKDPRRLIKRYLKDFRVFLIILREWRHRKKKF